MGIEHHGVFPTETEQLEALPGIGRSTAGAIVSMAFNKPAAILDGNVKRVLTRFHAVAGWPGETKIQNQLWTLAEGYTPKKRNADFTQAMMDLGALVCTRTKPNCEQCPLSRHCEAHAQGRETEFPHKKSRERLPVRQVYLLMFCHQDQVLLEKRPPVGIWGGLWSFPECPVDVPIKDWCRNRYPGVLKHIMPWPTFRHTFSHFHLEITPVQLLIQHKPQQMMDSPQTVWYNLHKPDQRGLASPIQRLLIQLTREHGNVT